jgi:hypothetical protein
MIRRLLIPLLGSGLLLAASAGIAMAKCEGPNPPAFCSQVVASMDFGSSGSVLRAGSDTPIRIWVTQGEQPLAASSVALVFARIADGSTVRAVAAPAGEAGLWRSDVNLPAGGGWTVVAEIVGADGMQRLPLETVRAAAPLTPPGNQPATPAPPVTPTLPALPIALLVAAVAVAGLVAVGLRQRSRRRGVAT